MTYPSQCEDAAARLWRKQQKLEGRLQSGKRMQHHTRERLIAELCRVEEAREAVLFQQLSRLVGPQEARATALSSGLITRHRPTWTFGGLIAHRSRVEAIRLQRGYMEARTHKGLQADACNPLICMVGRA